jgi:hypothetical protein
VSRVIAYDHTGQERYVVLLEVQEALRLMVVRRVGVADEPLAFLMVLVVLLEDGAQLGDGREVDRLGIPIMVRMAVLDNRLVVVGVFVVRVYGGTARFTMVICLVVVVVRDHCGATRLIVVLDRVLVFRNQRGAARLGVMLNWMLMLGDHCRSARLVVIFNRVVVVLRNQRRPARLVVMFNRVVLVLRNQRRSARLIVVLSRVLRNQRRSARPVVMFNWVVLVLMLVLGDHCRTARLVVVLLNWVLLVRGDRGPARLIVVLNRVLRDNRRATRLIVMLNRVLRDNRRSARLVIHMLDRVLVLRNQRGAARLIVMLDRVLVMGDDRRPARLFGNIVSVAQNSRTSGFYRVFVVRRTAQPVKMLDWMLMVRLVFNRLSYRRPTRPLRHMVPVAEDS